MRCSMGILTRILSPNLCGRVLSLLRTSKVHIVCGSNTFFVDTTLSFRRSRVATGTDSPRMRNKDRKRDPFETKTGNGGGC